MNVSASAHLAIQHPGCREHQWNVACHVDHGCPVDGSTANFVKPHHDVCDNGVLEPVHGVRCGTEYEYRQHQPATVVLPTPERWRSLLLKHHATCQHTGCWYNCYSSLIAFEACLLYYHCCINVQCLSDKRLDSNQTLSDKHYFLEIIKTSK